jgi:hypothetical protein
MTCRKQPQIRDPCGPPTADRFVFEQVAPVLAVDIAHLWGGSFT